MEPPSGYISSSGEWSDISYQSDDERVIYRLEPSTSQVPPEAQTFDIHEQTKIDRDRLFPPTVTKRTRSVRRSSTSLHTTTPSRSDSHRESTSPSHSSASGVSYCSYHDSASERRSDTDQELEDRNTDFPPYRRRRGRRYAPPSPSSFSSSNHRRYHQNKRIPFLDYPIWSSFPSHLRPHRSHAANTPADVLIRDFSPLPLQPTLFSSSSSPQHPQQPQKQQRQQPHYETPLHLRQKSLALLSRWSRLYRSNSSDMGRYRAGLHSHISRGGRLEYPELEVLPSGPVSAVRKEQLGDIRRVRSVTGRDGGRRQMLVGQEEGKEEKEMNGKDMAGTEMEMSAEEWASFYRDCVVID